MKIFLTYALVVLCPFAILLFIGAQAWIRGRLASFFFRQLVYPYLYRRFYFLAPITRLKALLLAIYCGVTLFYNVYNVNAEQASLRAGWLSVINTIPLLITGRITMAMKVLGLSFDGVITTHIATGVMVVCQMLAHVVIQLRSNRLRLEDQVQLYGFMAAVSLVSIIVMLCLRRLFFEIFTKTHTILAIFTAVTILLHPNVDEYGSKRFMGVGLIIYTTLFLVQVGTMLFQKFILRRRGARAYISVRGHDGIIIDLNLEKPIKAKPGQFIYLWMACSPFQTHPFMVVSEEGNCLKVLIQSQSGFSKKIKSIADPNAACLAWIDGPYGYPPKFGDYQSVFLVANGIGVAAHLAVLKSLLLGYRDRSVKTQTINFYWHMDSTANRDWVKPWIDELIKIDQDDILKIYMYHDDPALQSKLESWGEHGRVYSCFDCATFIGDLTAKIGSAVGDTIVSVSARDFLRDETRRLARSKLFTSRNVEYHVSDFQIQRPLRPWSWYTSRSSSLSFKTSGDTRIV